MSRALAVLSVILLPPAAVLACGMGLMAPAAHLSVALGVLCAGLAGGLSVLVQVMTWRAGMKVAVAGLAGGMALRLIGLLAAVGIVVAVPDADPWATIIAAFAVLVATMIGDTLLLARGAAARTTPPVPVEASRA